MLPEGFVVRRSRPNPYRLPDDHPVAWLAEAQQEYKHKLPPFVEKNQGGNTAGNRRNVTLRVTEDLQQGLPVEAEMTCWNWSDYYTFCTIDIGGQRLIVKGNFFDHYPSFRSWLGPKEGFSYQPVAFGPWQRYIEEAEEPNFDLLTQHANPVGTFTDPIPVGSSARSDTAVEEILTRNQGTPQLERRAPSFPPKPSPTLSLVPSPSLNAELVTRQQHAQEQQHHINTGRTAQAASLSIQGSPRLIQPKPRNIQASTPAAHYNSQHYVETSTESAPISGLTKDAPSHDRRKEHPPKRSSEPAQILPSQDIPDDNPEIQEDRSLPSKPHKDVTIDPPKRDNVSTERSNQRAVDGQPYGNNAIAPTAHRPQYQSQHSPQPISLNQPTKRKRLTSITTSPHLSTAPHSQSIRFSPPQTPSTFSPNPSQSSTPTTSLPSQSTHHIPPSSSSPLLPPHKQSQTTLFIAIPLSTDSVPLKLRSCMSLSSFFTNVLAISAHEKSTPHTVSGIRASFDWKREGDKDRAILLKRDVEDSFEVFLEIIDGAPCWGEKGGRCKVGVEVVLV